MTVWVNHAERERVRERVDIFGRNRYVSDMADGRAVTKLHLNFNPQKECLVEREREIECVCTRYMEVEGSR